MEHLLPSQLCGSGALAFDKAGRLYIADSCNYRVRKVTATDPAATPAFSLAAGMYAGAQTVTITDATPGAIIYYTIDGSTPTTGSTTVHVLNGFAMLTFDGI